MGVYNGSSLARKGVVVVVINYRLGPYGFFAHPLLTEEAGRLGTTGSSIRLLLSGGVQRNIAAFGGDPSCVTIFGESAGGASVACLLVSPLSKGLFQRAIMQSAPDFPNRHLREVVFESQPPKQSGSKRYASAASRRMPISRRFGRFPPRRFFSIFRLSSRSVTRCDLNC